MKILEPRRHRSALPQICVCVLALAGLTLAQRNSGPWIGPPGPLSVRLEGGNYSVQNTRTGQILFTHTLGSPAPGTVPSPSAAYTFRILPAPAGAIYSYAHGISSNGEYISGGYEDAKLGAHGLLYRDHSKTILSYPGYLQTHPAGINNGGVTVGDYETNSADSYGFTYQNGNFSQLNLSGSTFTAPAGINDAHAVVGLFAPTEPGILVGFRFANGILTTVTVPGASLTAPSGINSSGEIVGTYDGTYGFTYSSGTFTTIQVPGALQTHANSISNNGQIAGYYMDSNFIYHGFVLSNGVFTTVDYPGAYDTLVLGIADSGAVVGQVSGGACALSAQNCGFEATPQP